MSTSNEATTTKSKPKKWRHNEFHHLTQAEAEEMASRFKIDEHLVALGLTEAFYADIIRFLFKEKSRRMETAGVTIRDTTMVLMYNDLWLAPFSPATVGAVLRHEALHLILKHVTIRRYEPHFWWNWACDLAINCRINSLPNICLMPGKPFSRLHPEIESEMTPQELMWRAQLSALIASFPPNLSAEEYFVLLMSSSPVKEIEKNKEENQAFLDKMAEMLGNDDHDGWDEIPEEEREFYREKINDMLSKAVRRADGDPNRWGSIPLEMREIIRASISRSVRWEDVLANFCGRTVRSDRTTSIKRLSRKYPGLQPGADRDHKARLNVYIDQSGSMSDEDIMLCFGELQNLCKQLTITVYHFDTAVDLDSKMTWRKGNANPKCLRTRCGGTDFNAPTRHALEDKPDGYIILTDGGAGKPITSKVRRCYVLVPGRKLEFNADGSDVVVSMSRPIIPKEF